MLLAGRYRLVQRIAGGGMGTVHEGLDERLGRRVAVKVLREELADDPGFVARFEREARAAAGLAHPGIAQVLDTGRDGERHFIVMELVEGGHLAGLLRDEGRLAPERAAGIAVEVCSALGAAHAAGIVHRDVKPGNVLLGRDGRVKVTDFGIAHTGGQTSLTRTGSVLGTVAYLSPEQAAGDRATAASDVYAVGVLLYEMLTGSVPFSGDSAVAVALRHLHEEVPDVRGLAPNVPPALAGVVARATAKDPQRRFADGQEMEAALHEALARPDASPTAVLPAVAAGGPAARRRRSAGAAAPLRRSAAAAVLLVVGAGLGWLALRDGSDPAASTSPAASPAPTQATEPASRLEPSPSPSTPPPSPTPSEAGPVVPPGVLGTDVEDLEKALKEIGYDVKKVDVDSGEPEDAVIATIPAPGEPLSQDQTVVLVASKGEEPDEPASFTVPAWLVGSDAREAERSLKDADLDVKKVDTRSAREEDTVLATWPAPGGTAESGTVVLVVSKGE